MNHHDVTMSVLKIQASSKMFLVYLHENDNTFAIASLKMMESEIQKLKDNLISQDGFHVALAK